MNDEERDGSGIELEDVLRCLSEFSQKAYESKLDLKKRRDQVRMVALFDGSLVLLRAMVGMMDSLEPQAILMLLELYDAQVNNMMCTLLASYKIPEKQCRNHLAKLVAKECPDDEIHKALVRDFRANADKCGLHHVGDRPKGDDGLKDALEDLYTHLKDMLDADNYEFGDGDDDEPFEL